MRREALLLDNDVASADVEDVDLKAVLVLYTGELRLSLNSDPCRNDVFLMRFVT